jgi:hypothetical protein
MPLTGRIGRKLRGIVVCDGGGVCPASIRHLRVGRTDSNPGFSEMFRDIGIGDSYLLASVCPRGVPSWCPRDRVASV